MGWNALAAYKVLGRARQRAVDSSCRWSVHTNWMRRFYVRLHLAISLDPAELVLHFWPLIWSPAPSNRHISWREMIDRHFSLRRTFDALLAILLAASAWKRKIRAEWKLEIIRTRKEGNSTHPNRFIRVNSFGAACDIFDAESSPIHTVWARLFVIVKLMISILEFSDMMPSTQHPQVRRSRVRNHFHGLRWCSEPNTPIVFLRDIQFIWRLNLWWPIENARIYSPLHRTTDKCV